MRLMVNEFTVSSCIKCSKWIFLIVRTILSHPKHHFIQIYLNLFHYYDISCQKFVFTTLCRYNTHLTEKLQLSMTSLTITFDFYLKVDITQWIMIERSVTGNC